MPRDRTPPPKDLTDTGEKLAAVARDIGDEITDAFNTALRNRRGEVHGQVPVSSADSSEHIRKIARDEAERTCEAMIAQYQQNCVNAGPICGVWKEIDKMRDNVANMKADQAQERGEASGIMKAQARQTTIIVATITGIGVLAQIVAGLWKMRHG